MTDAGARIDVSAVWDVPGLPVRPGRDTAGIAAAGALGDLGALVVGGVDPADLPEPEQMLAALRRTPFVVSLELRASAVTEHADVVLPVAPVQEKAGTFVDWEGRWRHFAPALASNAMSDFRVLDALADQMDVVLGLRTAERVRGEIGELDAWEGERGPAPAVRAAEPPQPGPGQAVLSTWHLLLDNGRLQAGEPYLAGTAHRAVARLSAATAAEAGVADGESVTVTTARGAISLPAVVTPMPDRVVWLPANSPGSAVRATLGADAGGVVSLSRTGADA